MKIKAISFDFWNTLFEEQPGGFELYRTTRLDLLKEAVSDVRTIDNEEAEHIFAVESQEHTRIWLTEHRTRTTAERVRRILDLIETDLADARLERLIAGFEEGVLLRPPVLVDGAREVLENLSARYRLGLISDVGFSPGRVLRRVLTETAVIGHFESLVFSDEAGRSKPHAEVFRRTAASLGSEAAAMVHIGDLEPTDVRGAIGAGYRAVRFIGVTPMMERETTAAHHVISDLRELPELVESI